MPHDQKTRTEVTEAINRVYLLPFLLFVGFIKTKHVNQNIPFYPCSSVWKRIPWPKPQLLTQTKCVLSESDLALQVQLILSLFSGHHGINCYIYDNFFPEGKWFWKELSRKFTFGNWQDSDSIRHQSQPLYKGRHFSNLKMKANVPRSSKHPFQPHF